MKECNARQNVQSVIVTIPIVLSLLPITINLQRYPAAYTPAPHSPPLTYRTKRETSSSYSHSVPLYIRPRPLQYRESYPKSDAWAAEHLTR